MLFPSMAMSCPYLYQQRESMKQSLHEHGPSGRRNSGRLRWEPRAAQRFHMLKPLVILNRAICCMLRLPIGTPPFSDLLRYASGDWTWLESWILNLLRLEVHQAWTNLASLCHTQQPFLLSDVVWKVSFLSAFFATRLLNFCPRLSFPLWSFFFCSFSS